MEQYKIDELGLFHRYKQGDLMAKQELMTSLAPLINHSASRFANSGLPPLAIKLEGQRLASGAIDTYDPSKSQLNTHVTTHLKKLSRFVTNYQNVGHIPEPRALMIGTYNTLMANIEADKGRPATAQEIADAMSISLREVDRLQSEMRKDLSQQYASDDEDAIGFYEYIDPTQSNPKLKQAIEFVYFDADNIDKKILEMTFGLHGSMKFKANEIATKLRLTDFELKKRKENLALEIKKLNV